MVICSYPNTLSIRESVSLFILACRKLQWVLTNRILKFLNEKAKKDPLKYMQFYEDYGLFFREGIITTQEQEMRVGDVI